MANPLEEILAPALPPIAAKSKGGTKKSPRVMVQGCSKNAKFALHYGDPGRLIGKGKRQRMSKDGPCLEFEMNANFLEFLNNNLESCIETAGDNAFGFGTLGPDLRAGKNKIFHNGCIGDARHQSTGSWHNEGLAIDIVAFKIGSRLIKYEDALNTKSEEGRRTDSFFTHFRRCWAEKVSEFDKSCKRLGKERTGSVGNENSNHHHHLHISLPCRSISNGRSNYYAVDEHEH